MKNSKKLCSIFVVLSMILFNLMPVSVLAAGSGTAGDPFIGTGDLTDAFNGSITIHKFNISEWEKHINGDGRPDGAEDGYEIRYNGLKAAGTQLQQTDQVGYYYLSQNDQNMAQNPQPVRLSEMNSLSNITFRLQSAVPNTGMDGSDDPDDYTVDNTVDSYGKTENGIMEWTGVPKGYYIITEQPNELLASVMPPFVISMPMFGEDASLPNPDASEIKDIHIYPKNRTQGPGIEKDIQTEEDVNGNTISWQIRVNIPADIADAQAMVIYDTLSAGLEFKTSSLKVSIGNASPEELLTPGTHYNLNVTLPDPNASPPTTDTKFTVELTTAGLTMLGDYEGEKLHIDYDTVVNLTAEQWAALDKVKNEAQLDFTNQDGDTVTTKPPTVEVNEYAGLTITKTDGVTNESLAGATFAIFTQLNSETGEPEAPLLDKNGNAVQITTEANGIAGYYGIGAGNYYLTEVTPPTGYKPLGGYETITVTSGNVTNQDIVNANVKNYLDNTITLPTTGGMGTFWFTIIGAVLVIISGGIYAIYKKKRKIN